MPFLPIHLSGGKLRQPGASVAIRSRHGITYVDFRFSAEVIAKLGWNRAKRLAAHADLQARRLMFTEASYANSDSRALQFEGGHQLRVRFPRMGAFSDLVPLVKGRHQLPVVECGKGQLIVDAGRLVLTEAP